jgi:2-polyprenyl-3-methyl-5-hydroxy-6-metoxy-1,4-benzoquinol methylase
VPNVYQFKDFEGSSHRILLGLIRRYARKSDTLLDLGAAGGELSLELSNSVGRRIGFEYDVDRIGQLKHRFDSVVIADLETVPNLPRKVDLIVLADVLEHLRKQRDVLRRIREVLNRDGLLFVSVPNIANVTIRLGLLLGIFRYRERGILDETHVRFYTLATIREELQAAGFRVKTIRGSSVPIRLIVDGHVPNVLIRSGEKVLSLLTAMWKAFWAYQIILVAERDDADPTTARG